MNKPSLTRLFLGLLFLQALVNLIGALGPELGFDALWYHLTEAKLFWSNRSLAPLPGNLLYWSGFPRLMEIIYALSIKLWDERLAKLIHFSFGLLSAVLVYKLARKYLKSTQALAGSLLFYSLLLVGWLSTSAYVDLALTLFILGSIYVSKLWQKIIFLSLAGGIKLTAIPLSIVITGFPWAILGSLPFWIINWQSTKNPFYPFGEAFSLVHDWFTPNFFFWITRPIRLFFDPAFRVGPLILFLYLFSLTKKMLDKRFNYLVKLSLSFFLVWFLGPGTDTGRFALPLLALLSILACASLNPQKPQKLIIGLILFQALVGISVRTIANAKYLPVLLGRQSKAEFLTHHLKSDSTLVYTNPITGVKVYLCSCYF